MISEHHQIRGGRRGWGGGGIGVNCDSQKGWIQMDNVTLHNYDD